jgi:hypothetical protein
LKPNFIIFHEICSWNFCQGAFVYTKSCIVNLSRRYFTLREDSWKFFMLLLSFCGTNLVFSVLCDCNSTKSA